MRIKAEKIDFCLLLGCLSFLILAIALTFFNQNITELQEKNVKSSIENNAKLIEKESVVKMFSENSVLIECGRFGWVKVSAPQCPPVVGMEVTMSTIPHLLGWALKKDCVADLSTCTCPDIAPISGLSPIPLSEVAKWLNNPVVNN